MQIAIDVAGFTPAQADQLRRAMGSKRSIDRMEELRPAFMAGMEERGVGPKERQQIFEQLRAFADFGFPESHAFSFAHIVYASAWLKVHHPEHFYAAILAAQPMGFCSPASLIHDARRHGVAVAGPDVSSSLADASVEEAEGPEEAPRASGVSLDVNPRLRVRLGLKQIRGLGEAVPRIVAARADGPFRSLDDLAVRAELSASQLERLAKSGALASLRIGRRQGLWRRERSGKRTGASLFCRGCNSLPRRRNCR